MVKDKQNTTRLYDEDGYLRRAACVCIRENDPNQVDNNITCFLTLLLQPHQPTRKILVCL